MDIFASESKTTSFHHLDTKKSKETKTEKKCSIQIKIFEIPIQMYVTCIIKSVQHLFETVYDDFVSTKEDDKKPSNANPMNSYNNKGDTKIITKSNDTSICSGTSIWSKKVDLNENNNGFPFVLNHHVILM